MQVERHENINRLQAIDAARGTAMFLVCLSHFGLVYFRNTQTETKEIIERIGMIASPTFILISGLLLGFLYQTRGRERRQMQRKLFDKGLFLLTIGHAVMVGAYIYYWGSLGDALCQEFITDSIGVCIMIGPLLVVGLTLSSRLLLSLALYSLSWLIIWYWHPRLIPLEIIEEVMFGAFGVPLWLHHSFPLVPWFSLYLAATCIGEQVGIFALANDASAIKSLLTRLALGCLFISLLLKSGYLLFVTSSATPPDSLLWAVTRPFQKLPPSPGYFAFYGGMGLLILRGFIELEHINTGRILLKVASIVGQTSLFAFFVQSYLYFTVLDALSSPQTPFWPLYFLGSFALLCVACMMWHARGWNRLFTVKLRDVLSSEKRTEGSPAYIARALSEEQKSFEERLQPHVLRAQPLDRRSGVLSDRVQPLTRLQWRLHSHDRATDLGPDDLSVRHDSPHR